MNMADTYGLGEARTGYDFVRNRLLTEMVTAIKTLAALRAEDRDRDLQTYIAEQIDALEKALAGLFG